MKHRKLTALLFVVTLGLMSLTACTNSVSGYDTNSSSVSDSEKSCCHEKKDDTSKPDCCKDKEESHIPDCCGE